MPASAAADYYLRMGPVKRESRTVTREKCGTEGLSCARWAVTCKRLSPKRINCLEATWERDPKYPGELIYCDSTAKYGVGPGGLSTLRYTKPHCKFVPA